MWDRLGPLRLSSVWLLPGVLGIAAVLRFWEISNRGLLYWDEGKFCLEGIRMLSFPSALGGSHAASISGKAVGTAKPMHAVFIALFYAVLGVHDYSPLMMDALCSLVTVAVVYFLARRLFGPGTGLLAALLLAVSEYDLVYARSALSESDANLLLLGGVLLWSLAWERRDKSWELRDQHLRMRLAAALLLGAGFTTNYRLAVYIAVLVVLDLVLLLRRGRRLAPRTLGVWAVGLVAFPLLWELIDVVARARGIVLFRSEITYGPMSYLGEVAYQFHGGKQSILHFAVLPYVQWFLVRQGWPMFLLLLSGLALAALRHTVSLCLPALLIVAPYAIYVFAPFIVPRNLDAMIPFTAILAAVALLFLIEQVRASVAVRQAILACGVIVLASVGGALSWRLTAERSGFASAARYIETRHSDGAVVSNEVMMFYLRDSPSACDALVLPRHLSQLQTIGEEPYRYLVIDGYTSSVKRYLLSHGHRVARFLVAGTQSLGENPVASENGSPPGRHLDQHVDVYSNAGLGPRHSGRVAAPVCDLNRLA